MKKILLILLMVNALSAEGIFSVGSKNVGLTVGTDNSFGNTYTVLGATVNYFVIDNLSVGASYQAYLGGDPQINQVTVPVTYYLPLENMAFRPYLGGFYNQTFIEDPFEDYNIYGGRAGVSMQISNNSFMSLGWVQEFSSSANNRDNQGYPEFSAGLFF